MIFNKQNKIELKEYTISGQFEDDRFETAEYGQELYMLSTLHEKTEIKLTADSNISFALDFRHTDGHDGRFPILVQMRDWWGLSKRNGDATLITKMPGGTSTLHKDEMNGLTRWIVFCTNWQPGQMWCVEDKIYTGWKIGTVLEMDFTQIHGNANLSHLPVTFMQITAPIKQNIT